MKKRIKIDSAILSIMIIFTGFLFIFRDLYPQNPYIDDVLDFLGLIVILKGTFIRMVARGHKKANSGKGHKLVMSGPYTFSRNPMYLGSFMIGAGFILIVWPWWSLPIFGALFFMRFKKQVVKEEKLLTGMFGEEYKKYCKKVSRVFPSLAQWEKVDFKKVFNLDEAFSTKEKRGLWTWPLLAIALESLQEWIVFGKTILSQTVCVFSAAALVFTICFWRCYRK